MKVLICGGRDFVDKEGMNRTLKRVQEKEGRITTVIQGGANGADCLAKVWALMNDIPCIEVNADWNKYGKAAGGIRNQRMLDKYKPDLVIAFPGGNGTADMIERTRKAGILLYRVEEIIQ